MDPGYLANLRFEMVGTSILCAGKRHHKECTELAKKTTYFKGCACKCHRIGLRRRRK